jgi:hypothetical protein
MAMSMKDRWKLCEMLAEKLTISKGEVYNFLSVLNERGLVQRILEGDEEAIAEARKLDRYGKQDRNGDAFPIPQTALEAQANDLRLMLWAVNKIGDKERAKIAFDAVMKALKDT